MPVGYRPGVGVRNFLIEGVSGTGKTSVCRELRRRGFHAVNGDTDLAYQGDPETGEPTDGTPSHWHHIWHEDRVRALAADRGHRVTFFCGGSRNFVKFLDVFDGVFVLEVDLDTLNHRLDQRPDDEFGARQSERDLVLRLHRTGEDVPANGIAIDATAPLDRVVDEILHRAEAIAPGRPRPVPPSLKYAVVERERRFLVAQLPDCVTSTKEIVDRYVTGTRLRLREVREADGTVTRKLSHKVRLTEGPAEVACTNVYLDDDEWSLLAALPARTLRKRRHHAGRDGWVVVIDEHEDGTLVAEIDDRDEASDSVPEWLDVVRDVTGDEAWTGAGLAR